MGEIKPPKLVKLIIGILSSRPELFTVIGKPLQRKFGPLEAQSELFPFTFTDYYNESMGQPIKRQFLVFRNLVAPENLARIKVWTNRLEAKMAARFAGTNIPRPINLDPGYLTPAKLVLASTKDYSHRIYLQAGIYAEVTLHYQQGHYQTYPWTYPDYQTNEYREFFRLIRQKYLG